MSTKLKGFHIKIELIKFLEGFAKEIRFPESRIVEALIDHLKTLPKAQQKEILKNYLTKDL